MKVRLRRRRRAPLKSSHRNMDWPSNVSNWASLAHNCEPWLIYVSGYDWTERTVLHNLQMHAHPNRQRINPCYGLSQGRGGVETEGARLSRFRADDCHRLELTARKLAVTFGD
jgi:hypothetical protein